MTGITLIRKSKTPRELIHNISLAEVQGDGKLARFLEEHQKVKADRKRIGNEEKAKQRRDDETSWQDSWMKGVKEAYNKGGHKSISWEDFIDRLLDNDEAQDHRKLDDIDDT